MFAANAFVIRQATEADQGALRRLAELDSQRPLMGSALVGEIDGHAAAALSLADGRVIADPFQRTARLTPLLRMRARSLRALSQTPSLRERMRAGVQIRPVAAPSATKA